MNGRKITIKVLKVLAMITIICISQYLLKSVNWNVDIDTGYPWEIELCRLIVNILYGCVFVVFVFDSVTIENSKHDIISMILLGIFALIDMFYWSMEFTVKPFFIGHSMYFQLAFGIWLTLIIKSTKKPISTCRYINQRKKVTGRYTIK